MRGVGDLTPSGSLNDNLEATKMILDIEQETLPREE